MYSHLYVLIVFIIFSYIICCVNLMCICIFKKTHLNLDYIYIYLCVLNIHIVCQQRLYVYPYSAFLHRQAIFCHRRLSSLPPLHATCLRCRGVTGSAFGDLGLCTWGRHRGIWGITRRKVHVIRLYIAFLHLIGWISSASKDFWLWKCQPVLFGAGSLWKIYLLTRFEGHLQGQQQAAAQVLG